MSKMWITMKIEKLKELRALNERLNTVSGELNTFIRATEAEINAHGGRCRVSIPIASDANLVWAKRGKDVWGLFVEYTIDPTDLEPLVNAPRDLRLTAIPHFPKLLEALLKRTREMITQTQMLIPAVNPKPVEAKDGADQADEVRS